MSESVRTPNVDAAAHEVADVVPNVGQSMPSDAGAIPNVDVSVQSSGVSMSSVVPMSVIPIIPDIPPLVLPPVESAVPRLQTTDATRRRITVKSPRPANIPPPGVSTSSGSTRRPLDDSQAGSHSPRNVRPRSHDGEGELSGGNPLQHRDSHFPVSTPRLRVIFP